MSTEKYDLSDAAALFFTESREMLYEMETSLLRLEKEGSDADTLNALFRSVHTIKGSSGMFGFEEVERFTHVVENLLDKLRNGIISFDQDLGAALLDSHDMIKSLLEIYENQGHQPADELLIEKEILSQKLASFLAESDESSQEPPSGSISADTAYSDHDPVQNQCWHISMRSGINLFRNGLDPSAIIKYLQEIGNIEKIITTYDDMPYGDNYDPESSYIGFEIAFKSESNKDNIEKIFEFIKEDCSVRIIPPRSSITDYLSLIEDLPETPMHIGEMLVKAGSLTQTELDRVLSLQSGESSQKSGIGEKKLIGEIIIEEKLSYQPVVDAALEKQKDIKKLEENKKRSIRIDAEKLDSLINLVGELVITGSNVQQRSGLMGDPDLIESVSTMSRLIEDIRDSAMNIRMVQIGETFRRFERVTRDLSRERGKKIDLVITGGETELDKTLVEKLTDPLMHLIRNAVDHGIGTPDERTAAGKPENGTIRLNSYYETGSIVIEVSDDGNGLNKEKIHRKAVERGIIRTNQNISDNDLYQLIFEPGFSTAERITNISGRGVGMDVVKKNIESMRGLIEIESVEGTGTSFRINLPLTLAIIDGFMFQVGLSNYVVPLDMVTECIEVSDNSIQSGGGGNFMNLRGSVLPYMRLRDFFRNDSEPSKRENIIVLEYAKKKAGLIVDRLHGELQTVIKPLGKVFDKVKWASGSTILGTGDVAVILDVPMLVNYISRMETAENLNR